MHELGIAAEIHRLSRAAVAGCGPGRLASVQVVVGELSAIEPGLLVSAWEAILAGGPDAGARLEVDWRPARQSCPRCGEARRDGSGSWLRLCPDCGAPLKVEGGDELDLIRVRYDEEDPADRSDTAGGIPASASSQARGNAAGGPS